MSRGSKAGERRGGRQRGALNKKTIEKNVILRRKLGDQSVKLAKDVIAEMMGEMLLLANKYNPRYHNGKGDEGKFTKYAGLAEAFASDLAWYQSPRLATVKVGEDRENPFQLREGVTSAELRAELLEMFARGLRPSEGVLPEMMDLTAEKDSPVEAADGVANREE
jgi:hypothetical protein